jgi:2-iminobutanoate/2-iminopropanoate deaminase
MRVLAPSSVPAPTSNYSHGIVAGGFVFVAGTVGVGLDKRIPGDGGIEAQTLQAIDNVAAILAEAGATLANVVSATVYLSDMADYAGFAAAWAERFGAHRPARATVRADMVHPALKVEIEAIATAPTVP